MTIYRERLWASAWVFLATALVIPACILVFWPINPTAGIIVALVLYAGCIGILILASPTVQLTGEQFAAGRATLPLRFAGEAIPYREPDATLQRGRLLDARAWLLLRGWVTPVVRVGITDPQDPTPYWLISTREPEKLADAINAARLVAQQ